MIGSILAGLATGGINNFMSEWHADKAQEREKELMDKQNQMNKVNALDAYRNTVQGMKMAGLNPALAQDTQPVQAAAVSKGSGAKGENVELSPQDLLIEAQAKNLDAQTEKTEAETAKISGVDTKNVEADTGLKVAQKLLGDANKDKVEAEAKQIKNINEQFELEKTGTALFGHVIAQEWQKQPWYNNLTKVQRIVLDDIANGGLDMSPGVMTALVKSIKTNGELSSMMKNQLADGMAQVLTEAQMKDKKVMEALQKMPEQTREKMKSEINESYKRAANLELDNKWTKDKYDVYKGQDVEYLYNEYLKDPENNEKLGRWLHATTNDKANKIFDAARNMAPAYVGGKALGSGMRHGRERGVNESSEHQKGPFYKYGLRDWTENQGVQNMRK